jgi:cytochrome c551/c552
MKLFLLFSLSWTLLFGATVTKVDVKYQKSKNCKPCHARIVKEWEGSWHAKSHFSKDEYFKKSLEYVSRKTRKSLNATKIRCAKCHNPRIMVTQTDEDYEIAAVMGLDKDTQVNKAVNSDAINEGINCVVCHNVAAIHYSYPKEKRGIDRVEWTPSGVMTGPYKDAKSPYHKVVTHEFMNERVNELCFVCHANDRSVHGLTFSDMEAEYKASGSKEKCVECHMGHKYKDVASTFKNYNGKARIRDVRAHTFKGAHKEEMLRDALSITLKKQKQALYITLKNNLPHNVPSGFGARELIVSVAFKDNKGVVFKQKSISLTQTYTRKRSKPSTPHMAKKASPQNSVPAKGKKVLKVEIPKGTKSVAVYLYYRLVNDEVRSLLKLKEELWSKKFLIAKKEMTL